jgi:hypothetical protein
MASAMLDVRDKPGKPLLMGIAAVFVAKETGLFGFRVASAKASSLISFGTAFGILRKRCLLVEPRRIRPHTNSTK